jgi:streptomycin 6-kinase
MSFPVPIRLEVSCRNDTELASWLERLPEAVCELEQRWCLHVELPFDGEGVSCAWVAPAVRADGTQAVLKIAMPHMEGENEIAGLRFWHGNPTVRLLEWDEDMGAMLLERCVPGTSLRELPESEQDVVIAGLLRRLWRSPPPPAVFRPLEVMISSWTAETLAAAEQWRDSGLVREGLDLLRYLVRTAPQQVLLATDMHAGNVLRAEREPWIVIDPKPFVGDPAYDATQHLLNCAARLRAKPYQTIHHFAELLDVDVERVRLWAFARAAAEPRENWADDSSTALAKAIFP